MLSTTVDLVRAALKSDPTLTPTERARRIKRFSLESDEPIPAVATPPRIVSRKEAAERLNKSLRAVDKLAQEGLLPRRRLPGRQRAAGFLEADLLSLMGLKNQIRTSNPATAVSNRRGE